MTYLAKRARFSLGERVRWTSQAGGRSLIKEGEIVAVVPPHHGPPQNLQRRVDGGSPRPYESYIVYVPMPAGKSHRVFYWPRVNLLRLLLTGEEIAR